MNFRLTSTPWWQPKHDLLILLLFWSEAGSANLKEDRQNIQERQSYWASRRRNVQMLESYMMRYYDITHPTRAHVHNLIASGQVKNYNDYLFKKIDTQLHPSVINQAEMIGDDINNYLTHLPKIEITSYQYATIPSQALQNYALGTGIYAEGFMQSTTNLADLKFYAQLMAVDSTETSILFEIQSFRGRLMSHLGLHNSGLLFPKSSFFKIMHVDYDAETQTHLLRIQELTPSPSSAPPHSSFGQ